MSVRPYVWKYIIFETRVFGEHHGTLSKSEVQRLDFDLMQGNGQYIPDTGGLKRIQCGAAGHRSKSDEGWEAVFAEYVYSDIRTRFFVLLDKIPLAFDKTLGQEQKQQLRQIKERVDDLIGRWYEEIQAEDEEELDG
jgi:hypothetical protein